MFGDMNSGYDGYSMSKNATDVYLDGERPLSKWTKQILVNTILAVDPLRQWTQAELEKATLYALREHFLYNSSWHHTSKCCNETDFYDIDDEAVLAHDIETLYSIKKPKKETEGEIVKGEIQFEEWVGSRNSGHFETFQEYALIVDDRYAYTTTKRKDLYGKHVKNVKRFDYTPQGTAETFARIKKTLPKKYQAIA